MQVRLSPLQYRAVRCVRPDYSDHQGSVRLAQSDHAHLKRPHSPDPHLQWSFHAFDILEVDALPPTSTRRFPPEEKELLCHADRVAVAGVSTADIGSEACECQTADDSFIGLSGAMTPAVVVVETTVWMLVTLAWKGTMKWNAPCREHFYEVLLRRTGLVTPS